ncbi:glycine--tRNA ligase [Tropheryma whipplei]|uniref:glycine--tRNA ligase n=1 Tax=Tropheryma whipplei TaxID=2039 RepID=UPI0004B07387|nr:glycine--tRNA ligase [Tropheryma whipplei]
MQKHTPRMQDTILILQTYWAHRGCLVFQPMNTEVGAGTANPATLLGVLGDKTWGVAYVEPCVRPDDSRYGINPSRLQCHTQFQVLLKPEPGNPQEMYLESLEAIGIDLKKHDIRFVEDNWESPALGAWGLGWEIWLDGLEITQFTYFQQVGGVPLKTSAVEITYGIERIMMALQKVSHFKDIEYSKNISYGELFAQNEREMSAYYLEKANIERNKQLFEIYSDEAKMLLRAGLPLPAYTFVLKCSHVFNILDARGAISTAERAKAFSLMRTLTKEISATWVESRSNGEVSDDTVHTKGIDIAIEKPPDMKDPVTKGPETVLFEIGTEEMPSTQEIITTVENTLREKLGRSQLKFEKYSVDATPRRIVIRIYEMHPRQSDSSVRIRGPKVEAAFDDDKKPTDALTGFLKANGKSLDEIEIAVHKNRRHVFITKNIPGQSAAKLLEQIFAEIVLEIRSSRNMRWNDPKLVFSRPIRWLVALYGQRQLNVRVSLLESGMHTRVLRNSKTPIVPVKAADNYEEFLTRNGVILSRSKRREIIFESANLAAKSVSCEIDFSTQPIEEITDLVEAPSLVICRFEKKYLELPEVVLNAIMKKQKYITLSEKCATCKRIQREKCDQKTISQHFITFANGLCDKETVRSGNEAVIRTRFEDALFFQEADSKLSPENLYKMLDGLVYEEKLGSYLQKSQRIQRITDELLALMKADKNLSNTARQSAAIAKFDLASQMVTEMPELSGFMAKIYAQRAGKPPEVAQALEDMEAPRSAGKSLPVTQAGAILSIADRLDQLVAMTALGITSTGSSDLFGVRRTASGLVDILRVLPQKYDLNPIDIRVAVGKVVDIMQGYIMEHRGISNVILDGVEDSIVDLILGRWRHRISDSQSRTLSMDTASLQNIVYAAQKTVLSEADKTFSQLCQIRQKSQFLEIVQCLKRIDRICKNFYFERNDAPLKSVHEQNLINTFEAIRQTNCTDLEGFYRAAKNLPEAVNNFFDNTLVMTPEEEIRTARLGLLCAIRSYSWKYAAWDYI